jgi:very-short-patch-repair endonuclease
MDYLDYPSTPRTQYHHSGSSLTSEKPVRPVKTEMSDPKHSKSASDHMRTRARQLRRDATFPERVLWSVLRDRRLSGVKFRRQHPVGPYVVDFYCISHRLVVELDGNSHAERGREDRERQAYLESVAGVRVLRVGNDDVLHDRESVVLGVLRALGIEIVL